MSLIFSLGEVYGYGIVSGLLIFFSILMVIRHKTMTCSNCKQRIPKSSLFCINCGEKIKWM